MTIKGTSSSKAELTARYLEIHARNTKVHIESFSEATGKALGANVDAKSTINLCLDCEDGKDNGIININDGVSISNAILRGYDTVGITATGAPEYQPHNVFARAKIFLGAIGHGKAEANSYVHSYNQVNIGTGVTIHTANATIRGEEFSGSVDHKRDTSGFIVKESAGSVVRDYHCSTVVDQNTKFYIGDAAAGIVIDIYEKDGKTQVRQVGLKDEKSIWIISDGKVEFKPIANNKVGYLNMAVTAVTNSAGAVVTNGSYKVYDQHFIPYVRITNRTNDAIDLKGITLENANYIKPRVTLGGGKYDVKETDLTQPEVTVTNRASGSVNVSGMIANPRGSVSFLWVGKDSGNLTGNETLSSASGINATAPIWAHSLTIRNAKDVHGTEGSPLRFGVWLITYDSNESVLNLQQPSEVSVDATGDVYLALTHVLLKEISKTNEWQEILDNKDNPDEWDTSPLDPAPSVQHIHADGHVDLLLNKAQRAYRKTGTSTIAMPVPGSLEYITGVEKELTADVTLSDLTALARYLESYDLATGVSVYYLPNGTRIFTDANGEIIRIQEGGLDFGLADYSYDPDTNTVTLAEGVIFDLTNGTLSVLEGYRFETLLECIEGSWLKKQLDSGEIKILYRDPDDDSKVQYDADGNVKFDDDGNLLDENGKPIKVEPKYDADGNVINTTELAKADAKVTTLIVDPWLEDGSIVYYLVKEGTSFQDVVDGIAKKCYILAYDSTEGKETVKAYLLETKDDTTYQSEYDRENFILYTEGVDSYYKDNEYDELNYWNDGNIKVVKRYLTYDPPHESETGWYWLVKKDGSKDDAYVSRSKVYTFKSFLGLDVELRYDPSDETWYYGNSKLDEVRKENGVYLVLPSAAQNASDELKAVYSALAGKVWKLSEEQIGPTFAMDYCYWTGEMDGNTRKYKSSWQRLFSYYYTYTGMSMEEIGLILTPVGKVTEDTSDDDTTDGSTTGGTTAPSHLFELSFDTNPDSKGKLTLLGAVDDVKVKPTDIPHNALVNNTKGYKINENLYIQNDGEEQGKAIILVTEKWPAYTVTKFAAVYDSIHGIYESDKIMATKLIRDKDDLIYAPSITIKMEDTSWGAAMGENQKVTLEAITGSEDNCIARDIQGRYYILINGEWTELTVNETTENKNGVVVDKNQDTKLNDVTVKTIELSYSGSKKLTITEITATLYVIGETEAGVLAVRTVNGVKEYYLLRNGQWSSLTDYAAAELRENLTSSETTTVTMTAAAFVSINPGQDDEIVVGSDGSVTRKGTDTITEQANAVSESGYQLGDITGASVIITMLDRSGSLLDANDTATEKKLNIGATNGDVTFITSSSGSIGTKTNPLEISATGNVLFQNLDNKDGLETDTYLDSETDLIFGDITVDGLGVEGDTELVASSDGSISYGKMTVINGGLVDLTAAKNIVGSGKLDISTEVSGEYDVSQVIMDAQGDITLDDVFLTDDSQLTLNAGGAVTMADFVANGEGKTADATITAGSDVSMDSADLTESTVTVDAGGSFTIAGSLKSKDTSLTVTAANDLTAGETTLEDSTTSLTATSGSITLGNTTQTGEDQLTLTAGSKVTMGAFTADGQNGTANTTITAGSDVSMDSADLTDSTVTVTAGGDVTIVGEIKAKNSNLTLTGDGSISLDRGSLTNSTLSATARKDITFDTLEAVESNLTLAAGGTIQTTRQDGYIYFRDLEDSTADTRLTLSAGGDIGGEDRYLIVDTDDTLYIPKANSYYIDSVELAGTECYNRTRPKPNPDRTGRDQAGAWKTGELLLEGAAKDILYGELGVELNTDLAAMVIDRQSRENWIDLLGNEALVGLIRSGTIDSKTLNTLLIDNQPDSDLTAKALKQLLKQGDTVAQGETQSGYEKLAALLAPVLTAQTTDEAGTTTYLVEDEDLIRYLAESLDSDLVNIDRMAEVLSGIITQEELAEMIEKAWAKADYSAHEDTRPADPAPRKIEIEVGQATGAAFVENLGDILIRQQTGTLTAGQIRSDRGNASLTAVSGGIEGNDDGKTDITGNVLDLQAAAGVGANTPLTIEQRVKEPTLVSNVTKPTGTDDAVMKPLGTDGKPTTEATKADHPRADWALETEFTYDWIRATYEERATRLNVTAGGDVRIIEQTGDLGVGTIQAAGTVSLTAPGSILDTRTESQTGANITATGDAELNAREGVIGTQEQRLVTDVDGVIHATAKGDINIRDLGTLDLVADSELGQVNASAKDDLNLSNTQGDLVVGPIEAGGTATIVADGSLVEGDRHGRPAQVIANSIDLTAKNGDIGTPEDPFDVDTDDKQGGTLAGRGNNVYLNEISGNLSLKEIRANTDAVITAPGDILNANKDLLDGAVDEQKEAANAKAEADQADAEAFVRAEEAKRAQEAMEKAEQARDEAQARTESAIADALKQAKDELNAMDPETDAEAFAQKQAEVRELEKALAQAQRESEAREKALTEAQAALDKATADYNAAQAVADAAADKATKKRKEANDKQAQADKSKEDAANADPTIRTGNDLTLNAGGNIGTRDNGLTMEVGGTTTIQTGGENIHISGKGDLNLEEITIPGHGEIATVDGSITSSGTITAGSLDISALDGNVGKDDESLQTSTDKLDALGDNVSIRNDKDTEIGQIIAEDEVKLDVKGDVTGGETGKPDIIAGDITIDANGDIGTKDQPLDISGNGFHGSGNHIHLDNHTKDLDIRDVDSDSLDVSTDGNITGDNNNTHDIIIDADGYVGAPDDPFRFWADGYVDIHGGLGAWYQNLYQPSGLRLRATVVLRFDVTVNGQPCSLYVLVGITEGGTVHVIGSFLCQGEADEAFWMQVLRALRQQGVITLGLVFHDGEAFLPQALAEVFPGSESRDLRDRGEGTSFYQALTKALTEIVENAEAVTKHVEDLAQTIQETVAGEFQSPDQLLIRLRSRLSGN